HRGAHPAAHERGPAGLELLRPTETGAEPTVMLTSAQQQPGRVPDRVLRDLPKVCLHDHLDGALRPATVVELAAAAGHRLPTEDPEALGRWVRESADSGSLVRYLATFEHTVAVMQTPEALV